MFAKLKGILDSTHEDSAIIDVGGVGYLVAASRATLARLGPVGGHVSVLIDTHVREDKIALYAFASASEQEWFRQLYSVQGVGPKVALSILSALPPDSLATAIAAGDAKILTRADGVGPKLATRIVSELKGKVGQIGLDTPMTATSGSAVAMVPSGAAADAVSALINLGYGRSEAFSAVAGAKQQLGAEADVSALIRAGLKELSA